MSFLPLELDYTNRFNGLMVLILHNSWTFIIDYFQCVVPTHLVWVCLVHQTVHRGLPHIGPEGRLSEVDILFPHLFDQSEKTNGQKHKQNQEPIKANFQS